MRTLPVLILAVIAFSFTACGGAEPAEQDGLAPRGAYHGEAMGMGATGAVDPAAPIPFTTICPGSTRVYGVDVSYYQGAVNWSSVRAAGKQFAYLRYSDGTGFIDPNFTTYWNNAKAAGLTVGAYQFFRASQDPIAQADALVNRLQALGGTGRPNLPPVIDVETNDGMSNATVISRMNSWLSRVQSRTGRQPVLYTSPGYWSGLGSPYPSPLPYLWDAHWTSNCPTVPYPWGRLRFWQYSSTGSVSGISGSVDTDLYNGSLAEMQGL